MNTSSAGSVRYTATSGTLNRVGATRLRDILVAGQFGCGAGWNPARGLVTRAVGADRKSVV